MFERCKNVVDFLFLCL